VRFLPLVDRKQELRRTLARSRSLRMLYADHVTGNGSALFQRVCALDLEGIVAKQRKGHYTSDVEASTWLKIRNRSYSQWAGRNAFDRDRHTEPVAGWHLCDLAASAVAG
jgi:ATP-dependent DNA ligase